MTVRGGRPATGVGGNIAVVEHGVAHFGGVRVTDGRGARAAAGSRPPGPPAITISRSLIDGNVATGVGRTAAGSAMPGQTSPTQLTITDSTIARNDAAAGGGIATTSNSPVPPENRHTSLRGVTIAFNTARDGGQGGVGGIQTDSSAVRFQGSVIAGNTSTVNLGPGPVEVPTNCAIGGAVTDQGGNVEDQNQCGLSAASLRTTNPQLATTLDASQPPVLAIPATSPAVDFADCGGRTLDQRGVPRPQGALCDAGAYEFNPAPDTAIAGAAPPFTFSATDAGSTFECSLDGAPFTPCASPFDPGAGPGSAHARGPRGRPAGPSRRDPGHRDLRRSRTRDPDARPRRPTPTPTATPVVNRTIVVGPARGTVKVKVPGSKRYVELDSTIGIPVGSSVDTRKGRVTLTSIPKAGAPPQTAVFFDGLFRVTQSKGITNLTLTEQLAACPKKGRASAAAKKAKKRRLWGDGKGAFRTRQVQRRDRPRHEVAGAGLVRRDAHPRHAGLRQRPPPQPHDHRARRQALPGEAAMRRALLALAFGLALAAPASAAEFTVTTTADGGGQCPPVRPGTQCTLRAALNASASTGPDTITVPAGTYRLNVELGELPVDGQVTITGAGAGQTRIEGAGTTRVFSVTGQENRFIGLTIAGGREFFDTGGNVIMGHGAALELDHVRITDGIAARGGGIATGGGGSLIVRHSLIDNNEARFTGQVPSSGDGGGVLMTSTDNPQTLEVSDTTIAFNRASRGAGVLAERQDGNETTLQRVTIADNAATGARGGGLTILDLEFVLIEDSIIARNTGNIGSAAVVIAPSNCSVILPSTGGGNVESGTDCGLERKNTTGGLATALADNGGQTPTLALPWTSDVHDFAGACTGTDQRDVARPQGAGCDPGAYEATPPPPPVVEPTPTPTPIAIPTTVPTPTPTVTPGPTPWSTGRSSSRPRAARSW